MYIKTGIKFDKNYAYEAYLDYVEDYVPTKEDWEAYYEDMKNMPPDPMTTEELADMANKYELGEVPF
jgi:hypothetical protein